MDINRKMIKTRAKNAIRAAGSNLYLVSFVFLAISYIINTLHSEISGLNDYYERMANGDLNAFLAFINVSGTGWLLSYALVVMSWMIGAGFALYTINVSRMLPAGAGNLFDGFSIFFKVVVLKMLTGLFVVLWSMPFVIPGIVAMYRYRMALFVLIDNPHMSPLECIEASKELTNGRKGELFQLDLSFIGWVMLCLIPGELIVTTGILSPFIAGILMQLSMIWVSPYIHVTYANFYNELLLIRHNTLSDNGME